MVEIFMLGKPGPFQIIENESLDSPSEAPRRRYDCRNYETCLNLAAALNWDNFTCRGCNALIDESLLWRAQQEAKKDKIVRRICSTMPEVSCFSNPKDEPEPDQPLLIRAIGKR